MFKEYELKPHQLKAIEYVLEKRRCGLNLEMGLGKTICSLTAFSKIINKEVKKLLVIAPLNVARDVWHKELLNWEHTKHLTYSICCGSVNERTKALETVADVYIINQENVPWMLKNGFYKYGMIVVDESSGFKNYSSMRFNALRRFKSKYMVLLTGTPISNGYQDIWAQQFLIDNGKLLGKNITEYRNRYFKKDYLGFNYDCLQPLKISKLLTNNWLRMSAEDYLSLPDKIIHNEFVNIDNYNLYKQFETEFCLQINNDKLSASNCAVLGNKLLQYCNGAVYQEDGSYAETHSNKLDKLEEIINNHCGENILVAFNFKSDAERISKRFKQAVILNAKNVNEVSKKWNEGKIKLLLCQCSTAKGLNLQKGGRIIVWFSLTWNLESYLQFNARLYRQGQLKPVKIMHIIANKCKDVELQKVLNNKNATQEQLFNILTLFKIT